MYGTGFFVLVLVLLALPGRGQQTDHHAELRQRLADYERVTRAWEVDSILGFIEPALFDVVPPSAMREVFTSLNADTSMQIGLDSLTPLRISEIFATDSADYVLVGYEQVMNIRLLEGGLDESFASLMSGAMRAERYASNMETQTLTLWSDKQLIALRHAVGEPWYFVEYNSDNPTLLNMLVPAPVRSHFKLE